MDDSLYRLYSQTYCEISLSDLLTYLKNVASSDYFIKKTTCARNGMCFILFSFSFMLKISGKSVGRCKYLGTYIVIWNKIIK